MDPSKVAPMVALAAVAASIGMPSLTGEDAPARPARAFTAADQSRIDAAVAKRERKAARRIAEARKVSP